MLSTKHCFEKKTTHKNDRSPCLLKDVRAHCYSASLEFIRHARATSFSSACTKSKTRQNIELMTFALTRCANIFVGCSVTPTFFSADHFLFWFFPLYWKTKKISTWEVLIISRILFTYGVELVHEYSCAWLRSSIPPDLMTGSKDLSNRPIYSVLNTPNLDMILQLKYMPIVMNPARTA